MILDPFTPLDPFTSYYYLVRLPETQHRLCYSLSYALTDVKRHRSLSGSPEFRIEDIYTCIRSMTPKNRLIAHDIAISRIAFPFRQQGQRS